jgi:hypothetical protein
MDVKNLDEYLILFKLLTCQSGATIVFVIGDSGAHPRGIEAVVKLTPKRGNGHVTRA